MDKVLRYVQRHISGGWRGNQILKFLLKAILQTPARGLIIRMLAHLCATQIVALGGKAAHKEELPGLMVLSPNRFGSDLKELEQTNNYRIMPIPGNWQLGLMVLFYPTELGNHQRAHHQDDDFLKSCQENYRQFLKEFLESLCKIKKIDCLISANYWYFQDIHWGAVSTSIGIPYVVFFKEGFRTQEADQQTIVKKCKILGGQFEGAVLATQNQTIRDILLECGYLNESQTRVVGIPRMDKFVRSLHEQPALIEPAKDTVVTLFSFNPGIGLLVNGVDPWPADHRVGWGLMFEQVHEAFVDLAVANPDVTFLIKPKWAGHWIDRIEQTIAETGNTLSQIPNLNVVLDQTAHELIEKSQVVCCFNSSTILEAGVSGRAVIVPQFENAIAEDLKDFVKFYGRDDLFDLATDRDQLVQMVSDRLRPYKIEDSMMQVRKQEFEKWLSGLEGNATDKWCEAIDSVLP
jgi:hypothetical protein